MPAPAAAGEFDRRIEVYIATESRDAAGDVIQSWRRAFPRWARRMVPGTPSESTAGQQVTREIDTIWVLRDDSESRSIAPESHRIMYGDVVFEIVGIAEGTRRRDTIEILTASRPDKRGDRGSGRSSGQP